MNFASPLLFCGSLGAISSQVEVFASSAFFLRLTGQASTRQSSYRLSKRGPAIAALISWPFPGGLAHLHAQSFYGFESSLIGIASSQQLSREASKVNRRFLFLIGPHICTAAQICICEWIKQIQFLPLKDERGEECFFFLRTQK